MPLFSSVKAYKGQDFYKLKKEAQQRGNLFYDLEFPPEDKSLSVTPGKVTGVAWQRPKDIRPNPKLFVEGASSGDVTQGRLGNCWFVAACSCLAQHKEVWQKVIPDYKGQEWDEAKPDNYAGIFHFQFWRYGEWIDIVVDDLLPTVNGELIYIHSQSKNEFWSALLEKAYAKLFGSYEALDGGDLAEALEDFSGGVADTLNLTEGGYHGDMGLRNALFTRLQKEIDRKSLMAAAIPAKSPEEMEKATEVGLVMGHAYGVTDVKNVPIDGTGLFGIFNKDKIQMIRLRNPWGEGEWKGAFSDSSDEWKKIGESDRTKIGLTFAEDGEFWMTFDDFCHHFTNLSVCRVVNTSMFSLSKTWHEGAASGAWKKPNRAGGCMNHKDTFLSNPQFCFDVEQTDDEVMLQLVQKTPRSATGSLNVTIGFTVMRVEDNRYYRLHQIQQVVQTSTFKNSRSIFMRELFKKGRYAVIVSTFEPGVEGQFLFRLYTGSANDFRELVHDKPTRAWYNCCGKPPQLVTRIRVIKATGLEKQDSSGGADPYCVISCEGEKVTTHVCKNTLNPEWNSSAIFYRRHPIKSPLKVQVWNNNVIRDDYMGKHVFMGTEECIGKTTEVDLFGRKNESDVRRPGKLIVEITTSRNTALL